ncbi:MULTISPECIES: hemin uptake protein HemP [Undibacterium]|jgi:hemin uptake protein HemP|nr:MULTISPECIES: hemin uptake protein HemP [Undibacterium]
MAEFNTQQMFVSDTSAKAQLQPVARKTVPRLSSRDLMQSSRELEIDHEGRIYRLRITQLNKLILTA